MRKRDLGAIALLVFPGAAIAAACATSENTAPSNELDPVILEAGSSETPDAADAADADAGHRRPDLVDAGTCSASGLCVVNAPVDTQINVTSIRGSGPNDVWAVGTNRTVVHYDGKVWEKAAPLTDEVTPFTMRAVWLDGPSDVWIGAGSILYHSTGWNGPSGTAWSSATFIDGTSVNAIAGMNGNVLLARQVNNDFWTTFPALMTCRGWMNDNLVDLEEVATPMFDAEGADGLWSLAMTRPDEAWATSLGSDDRPGARVVRIHRASSDAGDPVGDGASWQVEEYDSRTSRNLYGVWGNEQVVWVVGEGGTLRRMTPAKLSSRAFETVASPVTADLRGIYGFGPDDVWAVGDDATVVHYDGKVWSRLATPLDGVNVKPRLFAVWGSSPKDVWIGGNGVMLHFEGDAP
ncbi:MAG: hypothetical protein J0I07_23585 [Myxococcales bacterium]|nr:hypothetical protein [Myxococcales bacterium]